MAILKGGDSSDWRKWRSRESIRQVVPEGVTISVELELEDGTLWPAQCRDISLEGGLVEFPDQHTPPVTIDQKVLLTLTLEGKVAGKVPGIVRHYTEGRMGILFPDTPTETVEQEDQLLQIVRTVEREILRQKTKGEFG